MTKSALNEIFCKSKLTVNCTYLRLSILNFFLNLSSTVLPRAKIPTTAVKMPRKPSFIIFWYLQIDVCMTNRPNPILKVILLGDSGVGKSSLINRYVNEKFSENNMQTIGVDLFTKVADVEGSKVTVRARKKLIWPNNTFLVANLGHWRARKISSA